MQALRRIVSDPSRVLQVLELTGPSLRPVCTLPSLTSWVLRPEAGASVLEHVLSPTISQQAVSACKAQHKFHSSTFRQRDGHGQSETAESRRRRDTLEEEPSASLSESDLEDKVADLGEVPEYRPRAPDVDAPEPASLAVTDEGTVVPQERLPRELGDYDLTRTEDRKSLLAAMARGSLDLFGRLPGSESSVPEDAMRDWMRDFRIKVVDVNRISKGSRTGGIGRFSALAVVGNGNGVIGLGMGKAKNIGDAIGKANHQALRTLFYVPRYRSATILHPVVARYGRCKVTMYPRSTGAGCRASNLVSNVCQLAGIRDIGVKVHGTRNVRNTVKALIRGFESQGVEEELADLAPAEAPRLVGASAQRLRGVPTTQSIGF